MTDERQRPGEAQRRYELAVLEVARHVVAAETVYRRACYPGGLGARRQEFDASRSYWLDQLGTALEGLSRERANPSEHQDKRTEAGASNPEADGVVVQRVSAPRTGGDHGGGASDPRHAAQVGEGRIRAGQEATPDLRGASRDQVRLTDARNACVDCGATDTTDNPLDSSRGCVYWLACRGRQRAASARRRGLPLTWAERVAADNDQGDEPADTPCVTCAVEPALPGQLHCAGHAAGSWAARRPSAEAPNVTLIEMQPSRPKLLGGHVHGCPECFEKVPCNESCSIEMDLFEEGETPCGAYVVCDACTAKGAPPDINTIGCSCSPDNQDEWCPYHGRLDHLREELERLRGDERERLTVADSSSKTGGDHG